MLPAQVRFALAMVVIFVVIMVAVVVSPGPVFFLFFRAELAKIPTGITVVLGGPLPVVDDFAIIPLVIITVIRVVDSVDVMFGASDAHRRGRQRRAQK